MFGAGTKSRTRDLLITNYLRAFRVQSKRIEVNQQRRYNWRQRSESRDLRAALRLVL